MHCDEHWAAGLGTGPEYCEEAEEGKRKKRRTELKSSTAGHYWLGSARVRHPRLLKLLVPEASILYGYE